MSNSELMHQLACFILVYELPVKEEVIEFVIVSFPQKTQDLPVFPGAIVLRPWVSGGFPASIS